MTHFKKGFIFIPIIVIIMLITAFTFSRHLDKQVDKYAEKMKERKKEEERITWRTGKFGPNIYLKETPSAGSKIRP